MTPILCTHMQSQQGECSAAVLAPVSLISAQIVLLPCPNPSLLLVRPSCPLLKLPLPGTGPVEFTTPVKDYSPPPVASDHKPGEPSERPEWVGAHCVSGESPEGWVEIGQCRGSGSESEGGQLRIGGYMYLNSFYKGTTNISLHS